MVTKQPQDKKTATSLCKKTSELASMRRYRVLLIVAWSVAIAVSLAWNLVEIRRDVLAQAQTEARAAFNKDLLYRRWAAGHAGVYVPTTNATPPNPYLSHIDERDIRTPSGRPLTLVNPAYMTRQVFELGRKQYRVRGHITSLTPIRKENSPDPWERESLKAFERGETERSSVEQMDGESFLRLMRPMVTEKGCLKCHAAQGYKEGEIRGGISVSVPMTTYTAGIFSHAMPVVGGHILLWIIGVAGLGLGGRSILQRERARDQAEIQLHKNEKKYRSLFDDALDMVHIVDSNGTLIDANRSELETLGYSKKEYVGKPLLEVVHPEYREKSDEILRKSLSGQVIRGYETMMLTKDGRGVPVEVTAVPQMLGGEVSSVRSILRDTTERKTLEEIMRRLVEVSSRRFGTSFFESITLELTKTMGADYALIGELQEGEKDSIRTISAVADGKLVSNFEYILADTPCENVMNQNVCSYLSGVAERFPEDTLLMEMAVKGYVGVRLVNSAGVALGIMVVLYRSDLASADFAELVLQIFSARVGGEIERVRAEEAKEKLEAQLRQSQKMEAVGQLAGGVAHDFNNLLQAILGYGDLALDEVGADSPVRAPVEEMLLAGNRAKTLVSQLLAFSRHQVLDMRDIDLNDAVADLMKMIRRLIGEHITLDIIAGHNLGIVRADLGQIEQILMNLCVNARDAMPEGGNITIETENVRIDEAFCESHPWAEPGRYVLLSVTDTGNGMDEETLDQVFEPFFTTKGVGEGTGLGLSTVFGLVKQHQGMVHVYSEVGKGTTFKIYLPWVERSTATVGDKIEGTVSGGAETILLAEDEEVVRTPTQAILERAGYTVLTAVDGEEALRVFEEHTDEIDLALLDVMMPNLGGRAVFERIREARSQVRVLFSSGYSMNAIHTNFVLDEGLTLIQKPYQRDDLLRLVREVLDSE